jgi:DNA-binding NarL/FixJ family response regulator
MKRVLILSPSAITQAGLSAIIAEESDRWQVMNAAAQPTLSREPGDWSNAADCALVSWPMMGDGPTDLDLVNGLPVVALLNAWSDVDLPELLQIGWVGLLPSQASGAEIVAALDAATAGLMTIHPTLLDSLLTLNGSLQSKPPQAEALTPREVEVLALLAEGLSNKAIARRLHLSEHTIKYHTTAIFAKLNVSSRTEAAIAGARAGLILL